MSTKHVRDSADLVRFKSALKITCDGWGNARTLDGFEAVGACFPHTAAAPSPQRPRNSNPGHWPTSGGI